MNFWTSASVFGSACATFGKYCRTRLFSRGFAHINNLPAGIFMEVDAWLARESFEFVGQLLIH